MYTPHLRSPLKKPMIDKTNNLLDEIAKKLDLIKLESQKDMESLNNKEIRLNTIKKTESLEDEESEDENQPIDLTNSSDIDKLESQFTDKLRINKLTLGTSMQDRKKGKIDDICPRKNWYPKPIPDDICPKITIPVDICPRKINSSYAPDLIYEWNIDGMLEYEIINLLHEMTLLTNVYKNNGKLDQQIAHLIVSSSLLAPWYEFFYSIKVAFSMMSIIFFLSTFFSMMSISFTFNTNNRYVYSIFQFK